jgi:hypothetical protein
MFKKPIIIFILGVILIATPLFLFPINLFNGAIVFENGPQKMVQDAPLSLSYFIGLGYEEQDMVGVSDFYLKQEGYILAFCLIIGFPALLAYRLKIKFNEDEKKKLK